MTRTKSFFLFIFLFLSLSVLHAKKPSYESLIKAIEANDIVTVQTLIKQGANVNEKGWLAHTTPLMTAALKNAVEIADLLIKSGAKVDAKSDVLEGSTALFSAVVANSLDVMRLLINAGANVNVTLSGGMKGSTPLMHVQSAEAAQILIAAGANVNAKEANGITPLMNAESVEVVKVLLQLGADINAKDTFGSTALDKAKSLGRTEIANLLQNAKNGSVQKVTSVQQSTVSSNSAVKSHAGNKEHHEFIVRILERTRKYVTDVNRDGKVNCTDYSITFFRLAVQDGTYHESQFAIVTNHNPYSGMSHMFIKFNCDGETYYIEPWLHGDYDTYLMESVWGDRYNPIYNDSTNKTYKYLQLHDKSRPY